MSNEEWTWQFRTPAKRTYDDLDEHAQTRSTDKLDEIVTDRWRDPDDYATFQSALDMLDRMYDDLDISTGYRMEPA